MEFKFQNWMRLLWGKNRKLERKRQRSKGCRISIFRDKVLGEANKEKVWGKKGNNVVPWNPKSKNFSRQGGKLTEDI